MSALNNLMHRFYSRGFNSQSNTLAVISNAHRRIHEGDMFHTSGKQTDWLSATTKKFLIDVPVNAAPHVQVMDLTFERGDIDFVAYEGTTTSDDGASLIVQNPNRNSSNAPKTLLYAEPTITDPGGLIFTMWTPPTIVGVGQTASGVSGQGQSNEWLLKPSTKYYILLTNNSGATIKWSYEFMWFELRE